VSPTRLAAACLLVLLCSLAAAAALSAQTDRQFPKPRCEYVEAGPPGPRGNRLVVWRRNGVYSIQREGKRIVVAGRDFGCRQATIHNVDRILLRADHETVSVSERRGAFAPGATRERSGSEIEIHADVPQLEWIGSKGRDRVGVRTLSRGRVGLQLDAAADGAIPDYDVILPGPPKALRLLAGHGADRLSSRGLTTMGDPGLYHVIRLFGEQGDDTLLGGPRGEWRLEDGAGDDLVVTGGGHDEVALGLGHDTVFAGGGSDNVYYAVYHGGSNTTRPDVPDRLFGGTGNDLLSDENRHRDLLDCGPGHDIALRERHDRPRRNCESDGRY
jgi:hypothetical protein